MTWLEALGARQARATWIAATLGAAVLAALLLYAGSGAGGGEGRDTRALTMRLPPAASDTIYSSPLAKGRPIVVIDAGHGGRDPGARSVDGDHSEKDLSLALALALRDRLIRDGRVRVALTRADDRYLGLDQRAAVARRLDAAMFVSLHMDSAPNPLARGASIYSLSDVASDGEAAALAASLNRGEGAERNDGSVAALLSDLALRAQMRASAGLAARIVGKSAGAVELRPNPHRFAAFHVLHSAEAPAVLVEAGYLSNVDDAGLLASPDYRAKVVDALARAIETEIAVRAGS